MVKQYLDDNGIHPPDNLYQVILSEVERPLIQTVLEYAAGKPSLRAANILESPGPRCATDSSATRSTEGQVRLTQPNLPFTDSPRNMTPRRTPHY